MTPELFVFSLHVKEGPFPLSECVRLIIIKKIQKCVHEIKKSNFVNIFCVYYYCRSVHNN